VETYSRSPTGGSRELAATGRGHCPRLLGQVYKGSQSLAIGVQVHAGCGESPQIAGRIMLLDMLCAMMVATVPSATMFVT